MQDPILAIIYNLCLDHIECRCHSVGTDSSKLACDYITGLCHCLPNVVGPTCDKCRPNYWKIVSADGCEPCNCDVTGSMDSQCSEVRGEGLRVTIGRNARERPAERRRSVREFIGVTQRITGL